MHLNGDALNTTILKELFTEKPKILQEIDFGDGVTLNNLDAKLYSGNPGNVVELREAKKH